MPLMAETVAETVHQVGEKLPSILPGVKFRELNYCHWLAMAELMGENIRHPDMLLPIGFLVALNKTLDNLADDYTWDVFHHHGDTQTALQDLAGILGEKTAYADPDNPLIYWGVARVGGWFTFVYCRPVNIPSPFLPST